LVRRCKEHNTGKVRSTKSKVPLDLVYFEAYTNEKLARARELEIKRNRSKKEAIISRLK
jgi:putative endonuclease